MKRITSVLMLAALVSGCAGGTGSMVPPPVDSAQGATQRTADGRTAGEKARVDFTIKWPKQRTRIRGKRGPLWISPSAASVVVQINDSARLVTYANAPKTGGVSTVQFAAPVGNDQIAFMLYDQRQTGGKVFPVGNLVGQAVVRATIKPGVQNVVKATIAGVAQSLAVVPAPNQPLLKADPTTQGFDIVGDAPQSFTLVAQDADGNTIVPQPAQFTVAPSPQSYGYLDVAVPDPSNHPQDFTAAVASAPQAGLAFAVQASVTDGLGNRVQLAIPLSALSAIYATYARTPSKASRIVLFAGNGKRVTLPKSAFAGIGKVAALTYDSLNHHVIVADSENNVIEAFNADGTPAANFTTIAAQGVISMTFDTNDQELYADNANGVYAFTATGTPINLGGYPAFMQTLPPGPLGFFPQQPYIIVGQGPVPASAPPSTSAGGFGAYNEAGTFVETNSPGVTQALGIASDPLGGFDYLAIGTPASASGPNFFELFPFNAIGNSATLDDPRALAVDTISGDVFVASGKGNAIEPIVYTSSTVPFGTVDSHQATIATPSGYATPLGLAITY